jgi:tetratricopeptide (TPR) repeat protein
VGEPSADLDLPAPSESNLPSPRGRGSAGFAPPPELDLREPRGGELTDLPAPAIDLPAPHGGQQLAPVGGQQLAPVGGQYLAPVGGQQLAPAGGQQLAPAGGQQLTPAGQQLTPAGQQLTPAGQQLTPAMLEMQPRGGNELAPGNLPVPKHGNELQPFGMGGAPGVMGGLAPVGGAAAPGTAASGRAGSRVPASPAPTGADRPAVSKGLLIAMGGLLFVGLAGAGVVYSGILDPDDPAAANGTKKKPSGAVLEGEIVPPTAAQLADVAKDTPAAYLAAFADAEKNGNPTMQAEALVLLAYRYGPDPDTSAKASPLVASLAGRTEPFAQRVVGLAALGSGDLAKAETALTGDDPRTRLYRGWLRMAQDKPEDAATEAAAVLATNASDLGALHLQLSAESAKDPDATLAKIQAAANAHPDHPGLAMLAVETALAANRLAAAREFSSKLEPGEAATGFRARMLAVQARLASSAGDYRGAVQRYDQAQEYLPKDLTIAQERVRALAKAGQSGLATTDATTLARENPDNVELQVLDAEILIEAGEGDRALATIGRFAAKLPKDPRVPYLEAQVHAMRAEVDEGRPLFQQARTLDPKFYDASIGEAIMLADARQTGEALAVFDTARKAADDAGDAREAARILVAKADVLRKSGQSRAAFETLSQAITTDPTNNPAQVARGTMLLEQGSRNKAKADLMAVFERTGGYPGLVGPLGRILLAEGKVEELETLVGDRLRGEATADDVLMLGAQLRLAQGEVDEASELIGIALNRDPNNWRGHALLSQAYVAEGKFAEALAEVESARPADPEPELLLQHGRVLEYNGQSPKAAPMYIKALELDPNLHEARFLYGRLLVFDGAHEQALAELNTVAGQEDAKDQRWYPEVWLVIGQAQSGLTNLDAAAKAFAKAHDLSPEFGEAYALEGRALYTLNKLAPAIKALDKAVELGKPEQAWYADALMNLGRAQNKSGKAAAAKATFRKFLEVAAQDDSGRPEAERIVGG